jgi:benzil reductase ((S)-benzoin forming)
MSLKNKKSFIITGTTRGLGQSLESLIMKKSNNQLISISRKSNANQLGYDRSRFSLIKIDLSKKINYLKLSQLKSIIDSDEIVYINNASLINPISRTGNFKQEQIEEVISVNTSSTIVICNFLLKEFHNKKITMINISSGAATKPISNWSLYCSTKAATKIFFEVLKIEHPEYDIYNIDPGVMDTDMQAKIRESEFERVNEFIEFKKQGVLKSTDEVAKSILARHL